VRFLNSNIFHKNYLIIMRFKNQVAVITGGARDIGREISLRLAKEGAKVIVNYFGSEEAALETVSEIKQQGGEAIAVKGDMTKAADVQRLLDETRKLFGERVHILVNNAGGLVGRKTVEEMDEIFWDYVMNVNIKSVFLVVKYFSQLMPKGASIINLSSTAAKDGGGAGACAYATSKGAVSAFTRAMAKELGPRGIRVNALCPGMIDTAFHDKFTKPEMRHSYENTAPLRRQGQASEIADAVAFLASEESSFITGANIDINGGVLFS